MEDTYDLHARVSTRGWGGGLKPPLFLRYITSNNTAVHCILTGEYPDICIYDHLTAFQPPHSYKPVYAPVMCVLHTKMVLNKTIIVNTHSFPSIWHCLWAGNKPHNSEFTGNNITRYLNKNQCDQFNSSWHYIYHLVQLPPV